MYFAKEILFAKCAASDANNAILYSIAAKTSPPPLHELRAIIVQTIPASEGAHSANVRTWRHVEQISNYCYLIGYFFTEIELVIVTN